MKNKAHTAIEMIIQGYSVETVMNITGLEPDEMMEILMELESGISPRQVHVVECVLEVIETEILGEFEINVN